MILLQHGWAFDQHLWEGWKDFLSDIDDFMVADRGYFASRPQDYTLQEKLEADTAIVHAFGLHLLPLKLFSRLNKLIIISGFEEYHPAVYSEQVTSERELQRMLRQLQKNPADVVQQFRRKCYYPEVPESSQLRTLNKDLLFDDLSLMNRYKIRITLLRSVDQVMLLHGGADQIVAPRKGEYLHQSLPGSEFKLHEQAGNLLPVTHPEWCFEQIKPMLRAG